MSSLPAGLRPGCQLGALALLCGCAPSSKEVATWVVAGELAAVADAGVEPWAAAARQELERDALRAVARERQRSWTLAEAGAALDEQRWQGALDAACDGFVLARVSQMDASAFQDVVQVILETCPNATCRAEVHAQVADSQDRAGWLEHRDQALRQAALGRYRPETLQASLARCEGVDSAMARAALELTAAEYRVEPDPVLLAGGALGRLELLCADEQVCALLGCAPLSLDAAAPADLVSALAAVDRGIGRAIVAGLPEAVAACEAVEGALSALDIHSKAIWPAAIAGWEDHHAGVRVGVGLRLDLREDGSIVARVPPLGSPAFEAGVRQGDRLLRLASQEREVVVAEVDPEQRSALLNEVLTGPPGSVLQADLLRGEQTLHFELERRAVPLELLTGLERGEDNAWRWWLDAEARLLYLRLPSFKERSDEELDALLDELGEVRGVLLDLRSNRGGDMAAALQVADRWVVDGLLIDMRGRGALPPPEDPAVTPWNAALSGQRLEGVPVVVLMDGQSASAAEVVAGALQERVGAVVVGEHSWGKGLAQGLRSHPLGFALEVTNGMVTLPSGRPLDRSGEPWGVAPDHALALTPMEQRQLQADQARAAFLRVHADGTPVQWEPPEEQAQVEVVPGDAQLERGVLVLRALVVLGKGGD